MGYRKKFQVFVWIPNSNKCILKDMKMYVSGYYFKVGKTASVDVNSNLHLGNIIYLIYKGSSF